MGLSDTTSKLSKAEANETEQPLSEQYSGRVLPTWMAASTESDLAYPWFSPEDPRAEAARAFLPLLLDSGSLTTTLRSLSHGNFAVEVVEERWIGRQQPAFQERFLGSESQSLFWSRKVVLQGGERDWVFAHTLIPETTLTGAFAEVLALGSKPLGEWLFSQPDLQRSAIELCRINAQTWGRRSWFTLQGQSLLVVEFFLPELLLSAL